MSTLQNTLSARSLSLLSISCMHRCRCVLSACCPTQLSCVFTTVDWKINYDAGRGDDGGGDDDDDDDDDGE